jgi:hypothetical protein
MAFIGIFVILATGGFMGLWTALKHSPTVRTRRFMCRTTMQWFVFIWVFILTKLFVDQGSGDWDTHYGLFFFVGYFAILVAFCSWFVYRWRILLEEDAGLLPQSDKPLEKTSLSLFWLRCWYWLPLLPILLFTVELAFDGYDELCRSPETAFFGVSKEVFSMAICLLFMSIPIGFFIVVGYGIRTSRNENSLLKWYPRDGRAFLPKSEKKTHWVSFGFDLAVMYFVAIIPMIVLIVLAQIIDGLTAWVLFSTMMMTVTTLIASHSAGIPGQRLRGYAKLCFFIGLCYVILLGMGRGIIATIPIGLGRTVSPQDVFGIVYFGAALLAFAVSRKLRRSTGLPLSPPPLGEG